MNLLQALVLGIVQGACEFFPISSSAHLKLARHLLGLPESPEWLYFDLACHLGTWVALVYYLRKDVWAVCTNIRKIALFALALTPLVPVYFLIKPLKAWIASPHYMGYFLFVTSALLFWGCRMRSRQSSSKITKKWRDVLLIGCSQALALIPGLSRSGVTMASARMCGWTWKDSAKFSFLLAIPTILGGEILESLKAEPNTVPLLYCGVGLFSAFAVGMGTVRVAFWMYENNILRPFAWYCLGAGLVMIVIFW